MADIYIIDKDGNRYDVELHPGIELCLVKHGKWIEDFDCGGIVLSCSLCDEHYWIDDADLEECRPKFCPGCGARMDGGAE